MLYTVTLALAYIFVEKTEVFSPTVMLALTGVI